MNKLIVIVQFMCVFMTVSAQRAPFAGSRPNGYKDRLQTDLATNNGIADRFGDNTPVSTEKLPHLALGDRDIVDRLNNLPVDQRPFWLINAEAIEAQKNQGRPTNQNNQPTNQNIQPTNQNNQPTNQNNQNTGGIANRFGTGSGNVAVNSVSKPNYPTVVYPIEMTPDQRQQAQQNFNNQIQQIASNNQPINANPLPNRMVLQKPLVTQQQTINNGPKQIPQPVQGRLTSSGYNG